MIGLKKEIEHFKAIFSPDEAEPATNAEGWAPEVPTTRPRAWAFPQQER
jgi:hypothetical protein